MRIQWLGTAAAEGWPALFCQCEACREAARRGGRELRSRSGALIDDILLIDLGPDLYHHKLQYGLDLGKVRDVLITHGHSDHFAPAALELLCPPYAHRQEAGALRLHGSAHVMELLRGQEIALGSLQAHRRVDGECFQTQGHRVTVLPAVHGGGNIQAQFYLIEDEAASLLYAHDTGLFCPQAWAILERTVKKPLSVVSLDCTNGPLSSDYPGHMGFGENLKIRDELLRRGMIDEHTLVLCNHFSHNGHVLYREACQRMEPLGLGIAYDGMTVTV